METKSRDSLSSALQCVGFCFSQYLTPGHTSLLGYEINGYQLLLFDLARLLPMKKTVLSVLGIVALVAACSSASSQSDTAMTSTTTVPQPVKQVEKAPEQQFIEDMWDKQAVRPGADIEKVFRLYQEKAAIGPKNMACWDPQNTEADLCTELVKSMVLLDVHLKEIIPLLESLELPWRLVVRDCEPQMVTQDIQAGRVNLETIDDVITGYFVERAEGSWFSEVVEPPRCETSPEELID